MANQMIENHLKDVNHVPKFDGTNFREWSYELRLILQQLGLLGLVEARVGHTLPDEVKQFSYHYMLKSHSFNMYSVMTCDTHVQFSFVRFTHMLTCINPTHVRFTHMLTCSNLTHARFTHMLTCMNLIRVRFTHMPTCTNLTYVLIHMPTLMRYHFSHVIYTHMTKDLSLLQIRDNPDDPELITNAAQIDTWILRDVTCRNYIFATLTKPMKEGRIHSIDSEPQRTYISYGKNFMTSVINLVCSTS